MTRTEAIEAARKLGLRDPAAIGALFEPDEVVEQRTMQAIQRSYALARDYVTRRGAIMTDATLSDFGKRQRLADLASDYQRQVATLADDADREQRRAVAAAEKRVEAARRDDFERVNALMADVSGGLLLILQQDVAQADPAGMLARYSEATHPAHRVALAELSQLELRRRTAERPPSADEFNALSVLQQELSSPAEAEALAQLAEAQRPVDVDLVGRLSNEAARLGVSESIYLREALGMGEG